MKIPIGATHVVPGMVAHIPGFLNNAVTAQYGPRIVDETYQHWRQQMTLLHGWPARIDPGHTMSRHGDPGVTYDYKGTPKPVHPFTPALDDLRKFIEKEMDWTSNCVVVNSYAPSSGLYPHRDGMYIPQLGDKPVIAALSFGAARTFRLHRIDENNKRIRNSPPVDLVLNSGDLLIMHGDCDTTFHHGIPIEPQATGVRISLTFRKHNLPSSVTNDDGGV